MHYVLVCGKREFPKLTRRTFEIILHKKAREKDKNGREMDKNKSRDNLGTTRTHERDLVSK